MTWSIELGDRARKSLKAMETPDKRRIEKFFDRLESTDNPRITGKALQGRLAGYWRYRVGDYRIISQISDGALIILVIEIDHRKDIYR